MSQEELADQAGAHRTYVSQVRRSEVDISIDNIAGISAALEVEAANLLQDSAAG